MMRAILASIIVAAGVCSSTAPGQTSHEEPTTTAPADSNLLAGPSIADKATTDAPASIVQHNFDGSLNDIGPDFEFIAIGKLSLTDEQRNWLDTVHGQRLMAFDKAVR